MKLFLCCAAGALLVSCASLEPKPKNTVKSQLATRWAKVCREDEEKFCAKWTPKDGSRADCLARAEKELSGRCYQVLRESAGPCVFDRARWCPELRPTDPRMGDCLDRRAKEVSLACRTFRSDLKVREASLRKACGEDATRLCTGEGAPWRCLRENLESLSLSCRGEMAKAVRSSRRAG